ncbi:hypothetical protein DPMN_119361 [Dreissena polymorpha]|uniref:Uncharacterized protein n=1 Tax=Dreissena polymorpha TaxID=45954 RepID=A0A9D4JMN0_DREPO|nr:hypothetical protein DPMN_119361 [Dreissena polymorpha]
MAESGHEPTINDVMNCVRTIDTRLVGIERILHAVDSVEQIVCDFDKEFKKIWVALEDKVKRTDARACVRLKKRWSWWTYLEKERNELRDDVAYLKSQSMRNYLVFTHYPADNSTESDPPKVTERKLRSHHEEKLKIAKETADAPRLSVYTGHHHIRLLVKCEL